MLVVTLAEISEQGITRQYRLDPHDLPEVNAWEETGDLKLNAPVFIEVRIFRTSHFIEVQGELTTTISTSCGRCLKALNQNLCESFSLTFTNEPFVIHEEGEAGEEGIELSADELGLIAFEGDSIDLLEAFADQLYLALPLRPLCSQECKGLCPQCGIDLNNRECGCRSPDFNNKFSALKNLKIN